MLDTLRQDVRYGLRALRKNPGFTAAAALTLGLGIGANTVMLSLVRGLLWRPGRRAAGAPRDRVRAEPRGPRLRRLLVPGLPRLQAIRRRIQRCDRVLPVPLSLGRGGSSDRAWGEMVSGNYFDVLGVRATLGRTLVEEDDRPGAEGAVVLSHQAWVSRFQRDPRAIGSTLRLSGHSFTVVGIAPEDFSRVYFTGFRPDLWVPAHALERLSSVGPRILERGATSFRVMGRLKPGATIEQAQAVTSAIAARLEKEFPATNTGLQAAVLSERGSRPEPQEAQGSRLMAGVFLGGSAWSC